VLVAVFSYPYAIFCISAVDSIAFNAAILNQGFEDVFLLWGVRGGREAINSRLNSLGGV
jgi:hypothetical protein